MRVARLLLAVALLAVPTSASADEAIWALLKSGGQVVIMRHAATVPNVPDTLASGCATQRNLSEAGREDARRIGAAFRAHGIAVEDVRASGWCRCMDTARLAFGSVTNWPHTCEGPTPPAAPPLPRRHPSDSTRARQTPWAPLSLVEAPG